MDIEVWMYMFAVVIWFFCFVVCKVTGVIDPLMWIFLLQYVIGVGGIFHS